MTQSHLWSIALGGVLLLTAGCAPNAGDPMDSRSEADKSATLAEMVQDVRARYPEVEGVDAAEVAQLVEQGNVVLVDVRDDKERAVSAIAGAITMDAFRADLERYVDQTVVAYCTVGERSARFARELGREGVQVLNFEGSLLAWTHYGGPLVSDDGPTQRLHVYGETWDLAADGYETVW